MRRKEEGYYRKYLETRKREAEKKGKEKQIVFLLFFCFFGAKNKSALSEIGKFFSIHENFCVNAPAQKGNFQKGINM